MSRIHLTIVGGEVKDQDVIPLADGVSPQHSVLPSEMQPGGAIDSAKSGQTSALAYRDEKTKLELRLALFVFACHRGRTFRRPALGLEDGPD